MPRGPQLVDVVSFWISMIEPSYLSPRDMPRSALKPVALATIDSSTDLRSVARR